MSHIAEETYSVYDERRVRARKQHICGACREPIVSGHTYWRIGVVFEKSAETLRRCERCQALHVHLRGLGHYDVWPDERLSCGQSYEDEWGDLPDDVAELAFVTAEEMQQRAGIRREGGK
jgi:hypothetical protein